MVYPYLHEHLPVLLNSLVGVLGLLLLLRLDSNVEVDLELLVFKAIVERVSGPGLGLALRGGGQDPSLQHDSERGVEGLLCKHCCASNVIICDSIIVVEQ